MRWGVDAEKSFVPSMVRRPRLAAFALALSVACGARTPLLLPGEGPAGGREGTGSAPCGAALLANAPTPMQGYCPTRANRASLSGPRAPQIAWTAVPFAISDPEDYLPAQVVVDASGRSYVAVDASPLNTAGGPNRISAIDADGTVVWTQSLPGAMSDLALGSDGTLWLMEQVGTYGTIVGLATADGSPRASFEVGTQSDAAYFTPTTYDSLAIGVDGSFFLGAPETTYLGSGGGGLAHVGTDGTLLWQTPMGGPDAVNLTSPVTLTQDDHVFGWGGELVELDAEGDQLWQETILGSSYVDVLAGAVDASGRLVAVGVVDAAGTLALATVDGTGHVVASSPLGATQNNVDVTEIALAGDGTAVVLLANEVASPGTTNTQVLLQAIDAGGQTRWSTGLHGTLPYDPAALQTHYGLFIDAAGTVVVTAGLVTGLDLSSGTVQWTVTPPSTSSCLRPAVLGAGGSIIATQCDGTVLAARDP